MELERTLLEIIIANVKSSIHSQVMNLAISPFLPLQSHKMFFSIFILIIHMKN
jgi:hypothetical protein